MEKQTNLKFLDSDGCAILLLGEESLLFFLSVGFGDEECIERGAAIVVVLSMSDYLCEAAFDELLSDVLSIEGYGSASLFGKLFGFGLNVIDCNLNSFSGELFAKEFTRFEHEWNIIEGQEFASTRNCGGSSAFASLFTTWGSKG